MKCVDFLRFFVAVVAVSSLCKFTDFACVAEQHGGHGPGTGTQPSIRYSREVLLSFRSISDPLAHSLQNIPAEMKAEDSESMSKRKKRKKGKRGGVRRRLRRNKHCPPLPSMIVTNVRSIRPKSDNLNFEELQAYASYISEFRDACLLCISETWFCDKISDESVSIDGFGVPFRTDRDAAIGGKKRGGGVCLYVNERWCSGSNVTVRKQLNTPDLDLLSVSLRPRYLPREFGQLFVMVIYTPPQSNPARAASQIADVVRELQMISPDAPNFIAGDFNSCDLCTCLPTFHQYVTVPTRKNKTIDLLYGNVPDAFKSFVLPPVGKSDHDSVHLVPTYTPKIKSESVFKKTVKVWSQDSIEQLRGCYECTDWNMFLESSDSVNEAADVITDYITFCEDTVIPTKTVKVFPNNKPWITRSLKATLNEKKLAFQIGDKDERRRVQAKLRKEILEAKKQYKDKIESQFQHGNIADAWKGLKTLSGQAKQKPRCTLPLDEQQKMAQDLNSFYCRFERDDVEIVLDDTILHLRESVADDDDDFEIEGDVVCSMFKKLNVRKAAGPDGLGGRTLKWCAAQLSVVFCKLFTWSLRDCIVPDVWKKSTICPVPKNNRPKQLNDFRPVALTSIVMKSFERIILSRLLSHTQPFMDRFQFAYKRNRGTDDATLTLLQHAYSHLEKPGSFVRILFIDFSSAFNTIQPHLLAQKLLSYNVTPRLVLWLVQFLVHRTQSVRFHSAISSIVNTSTGAPQGTVLSPVLFTLYTNDCQGTNETPVVKYSDDSALEDLSNSDSVYFSEVERFSSWCKENYLDLNATKTKELVIDFRRNPDVVPDLFIDGVKVERVNEYKYLGTIIDSKLNFSANSHAIHRKCQSRIYCLQKLRSLHVDSHILQTFYTSFIESVLTFSFICWYGGLCVKSKNVLERVVNVCGKIVGVRQEHLTVLYERRVVRKASCIIQDRSHVLAHHFEVLPSGRRYRVPKFHTVRTKNSFIPKSIELLNT